MKSHPLISIIMPVYNAMPFLPQAVQSIFAQTIQDWELIAIDDSSTDRSLEYLSQIDDPRVRVYRNNHHMGNSFTCNRGTDLSTGKYIAKMDADDLSFPKRFERQIETLDAFPEIDVIGCGFYRVKEDLTLIYIRKPPKIHKDIIKLLELNIHLFFGPNFFIHDGALMGRSEWFHKWKYDDTIMYSQDFDRFCQAQHKSTYANISDPLYVYRRGGVTSPWNKQTIMIFNKAKSIFLYGFRRGTILYSILGLLSLLPRPFFYAVYNNLRTTYKHSSIARDEGWREDIEYYQKGLKTVLDVNIPLKK